MVEGTTNPRWADAATAAYEYELSRPLSEPGLWTLIGLTLFVFALVFALSTAAGLAVAVALVPIGGAVWTFDWRNQPHPVRADPRLP